MLNNLSRWLDLWLQKTNPFITTYLKDSGQLPDLLKGLDPPPPDVRLFTADTYSMYTITHTYHALQVIGDWLDSIADQLPNDLPSGSSQRRYGYIVMRNNVFEWGDKNFL